MHFYCLIIIISVTETYETNAEIAAEEVEIDEIISSSSSEDYTYSSVSPRDEHSASSTTSSEADLSEDDDSFADDSDYHEPSSRRLVNYFLAFYFDF